MDSLGKSLHNLRVRIEAACERADRDPAGVTLIGASKTVSAVRLQEFLRAGLTDAGENYVQEGVAKISEVARLQSVAGADRAATQSAVRWHLIGALQSNKARMAVSAFDLIHSVDRVSLAWSLDRAAREAGQVQDVLLQVNIGGETGKSGCAPSALPDLLAACEPLPNIAVRGLMCLPPFDENAEASRPHFRHLRELAQRELAQRELAQRELAQPGWQLSMGMSHDFEIAIEEGATMIRVGTALFGSRAASH